MGFLPVEPRFFRQFNETSIMGFPLVEPNALFDLLHTDRLAFFYKNMNFTVPNRPNQPDQFLLLGSQFYALLRVHIPPDFLLKHYRVICHASVPRSQGGRIQRQSILQAGARGYASHVITIYRGDFSISDRLLTFSLWEISYPPATKAPPPFGQKKKPSAFPPQRATQQDPIQGSGLGFRFRQKSRNCHRVI